MNAISNNIFAEKWKEIGKKIPTSKAILMISAHWLTNGIIEVTDSELLETIYDFGGFPDALYRVQYPASGDKCLSEQLIQMFPEYTVNLNKNRGLDHGAWSILTHMFPSANIPVIQMSIDYSRTADFHYNIGKKLSELRRHGILILASGNTIHNLQMIDWKNPDMP